MALQRYGVVLCAIFSVSFAANTFPLFDKDLTSCKEACTKSYSPHTNPTAENNNACYRGCRFYSLSNFVKEKDPNFLNGTSPNPIKTSCENTCVVAYNETSPRTVACKYGCETQDSITKAEAEKEEEDTGPSIHLLSPLVQVRSVYYSIVGAIRIVRSSLVTYFLRDDSSIIAVESEPQIVMEVIPDEEREPNMEDEQPNPRQLAVSGEEGNSGQPTVKYLEPGNYIPKPHIVLMGVLALSFISTLLIYTICITFVPRKSKAYKGGLSVQADPLPIPVKLVRPEDLTKLSLTEEDDENLQAPPLPSKVALPDTLI